MFSLEGQKALVVGIANEQSIAWGCAKALRAQGADLAVTWLNDKAERFVRPLAEELDAEIMMPLDVSEPGQLEAVHDEIAARWGRLDTVLQPIAFAPRDDLHGRVVDCPAEGFALAISWPGGLWSRSSGSIGTSPTSLVLNSAARISSVCSSIPM